MVGIIILNYNTKDETIECVESIISTTHSEYKIYIIDNKSTDDSYEYLNNLYSNSEEVQVISSNLNGGYSVGNNIGINKALIDGADMVILSNSDIIYGPEAIDGMYHYLLENTQIGIIGPKILLLDGTIQNSPRINYTFMNYIMGKKPFKYFDVFGINEKSYFAHYDYKNELIFKGLVSGCCIGLSRKYLEICGLLDENTFLYFEEAIIANKAIKTDIYTCVLPKSSVLHKSSISIGKQNSAFSRYHRFYSSTYFLKKYVDVNLIQFLTIIFINAIPLVFGCLSNSEYRKYLVLYIRNALSLIK